MDYTIIIREPNWRGLEPCLAKRLFDHEDSPVTAVGVNNESTVEYLSRSETDDEDKSWSAAETALAERWKADDCENMMMQMGNYFMISGDDLTASDICNQTLMKKLQSDLGSEKLYVAIPHRMVLLAGSDEDEIRYYAKDHFIDGYQNGLPIIDSGSFTLDKAQIIGFTPQAVDLPEMDDEDYEDEITWGRPNAGIGLYNGKMALILEGLIVSDPQELSAAIQFELDAYLHVLEDETFEGEILFKAQAPFFQSHPEESQEMLMELSRMFSEMAKEYGLETMNGEDITISIIKDK